MKSISYLIFMCNYYLYYFIIFSNHYLDFIKKLFRLYIYKYFKIIYLPAQQPKQ